MGSSVTFWEVAQTLATRLITAVGVLGVGIAVARSVGPSGTGIYALAVLLTSLLVLFLGGALTASVVHHASTGKAETVDLAGFITATTIITLAICLPFALVAFVSPSDAFAMGIRSHVVGIALLAVPTETAVSLVAGLLRGSNRLGLSNVLLLSRAILLLGSTILLIGPADLGVIGAVAALPVAGMATLFVGLPLMRLPLHAWRPRWTRSISRLILGYSIRGYVANIAQFLNYRFDLLVIEASLSTASVGVYSVAVRFSELLWQLPNAVAYVILPGVARVEADALGSDVRRVLRVTMTLTTILAVALAAAAPLVIPWFFGEAFRDAVKPLWFLLPGAIAMGVTKVLGNVLSGRGRPGLASGVSGGSLLATVILDLAFIPRFGIVGAAVATSISYLLTLLLAWVAYSRLNEKRV